MKQIHQTYTIKAPLDQVWQALVDPETIRKWSGEPAKMSDQPGEAFDLWSGSISGINKTVQPMNKLTQAWRDNDWAPDHFSEVVFSLSAADGVTTVKLDQTGVPEENIDDIADGWKRYYLGEIKGLLDRS